jgi:hypothetical protein
VIENGVDIPGRLLQARTVEAFRHVHTLPIAVALDGPTNRVILLFFFAGGCVPNGRGAC